jgi:putative transposase
MKKLYQSFLLMLAGATDRELAQQVEFLKAENAILRGKLPKRITVSPQEKQRLLRFGKALGAAIKSLISIVSPRTFLRWLQQERQPQPVATPRNGPGRPRTPEEVRELVLQLARDNAWGTMRILGELKKLGVGTISRTTIRNLLKEAGLEPGPKRGEGTWADFVQRNLQTLWACDFFSQRIWTGSGLVDVFVLFFLHYVVNLVMGPPSLAAGCSPFSFLCFAT